MKATWRSRFTSGLMLFMALSASGQGTGKPGSGVSPSATRYFKLTLVLKYPASAEAEPVSQTITTEVAVSERSGSCKARMTSQVPVGTGTETKFIDVGTKFDGNEVRLDGDGLAMSIVLETSRLTGMVAIKNHASVETQEPIISQRTIALAIKLPLDTPKVIFDTKSVDSAKLKPLALSGGTTLERPVMQDAAMQVEMTATELK